MSTFIFKNNITLVGEMSSKDATSAEWSNVYSTVRASSATWNNLTVVNVDSDTLIIDQENQDLYDKKFIDLRHENDAIVIFGSLVRPGFNCRIFNDSTNYILLSATEFNVKSKGNSIQEQYGTATIEFDGEFFYIYGDLSNYVEPTEEEQEIQEFLITNEDLTLIQDQEGYNIII